MTDSAARAHVSLLEQNLDNTESGVHPRSGPLRHVISAPSLIFQRFSPGDEFHLAVVDDFSFTRIRCFLGFW